MGEVLIITNDLYHLTQTRVIIICCEQIRQYMLISIHITINYDVGVIKI